MLKICNISKSFNKVNILDNVSVTIAEGSIFGLAGPSGSGKSTLLRCIQRLESSDSGEICCNHKVAFMFQDFQLFPHMTVLQNLIYAPALKSTAEEKQLFIYKAREILRDLGIEEKASVYPGTLSGGQKQRVALARSLMIDPDVLLCDEPTSGLDMVSIMDVVALLQKVNEQLGVTIVIASHDLVFLTKVADRIALIKSGKIAVDLKPSQCTDPVKDLKEYY